MQEINRDNRALEKEKEKEKFGEGEGRRSNRALENELWRRRTPRLVWRRRMPKFHIYRGYG